MNLKKIFSTILEKFKIIFLKDNKKYKKMYEEIQVGDIIWAKRYSNLDEKEFIKQGHLEGPFIVIKKEDNILYSVFGSSVIPDKIYEKKYFLLNNEYYKLLKNTYFRAYQINIINENSLIKVLDFLSDKDKNKLFKTIKLQRIQHYDKEGNIIDFELPLQAGDIVKYNNINFIIIDIVDNRLLLIPVFIEIDSSIKIKGQWLTKLDYSNVFAMDYDNDITYLNTLENDDLMMILNSYKQYMENLKNNKKIQRGSVLKIDNKMYYVYGEEKKELLLFEIFDVPMKNSMEIKILNNSYYTNYSNLRISKNDNIRILCCASENDKDNIKLSRKKYFEDNNIKRNNQLQDKIMVDFENMCNDLIEIGSIIRKKNSTNEKFIVREIIGNIVACDSIFEQSIGKFRKQYFNKDDIEIIPSKQKVKRK